MVRMYFWFLLTRKGRRILKEFALLNLEATVILFGLFFGLIEDYPPKD